MPNGNAEITFRITGHFQNEYRISLWTQTGSAYPNCNQFLKYLNGQGVSITNGNIPSPTPIISTSNVRIDVISNTFSLYINGQFVDSYTDTPII